MSEVVPPLLLHPSNVKEAIISPQLSSLKPALPESCGAIPIRGDSEEAVNKAFRADDDLRSGATKADRTALTEAESYLVRYFPLPHFNL